MTQFIGREAELKELKSIWQLAREGKPQVVNYIADTGVGKTRLIQAFYEWLSTDPNQGDGAGKQGYWPDDLGIGRQRVVNPPLDRFGPFDLKNRSIPWLWWGMYWTDAQNDFKTALTETSPFLDVHLKMLEINRSCDKALVAKFFDFVASHAVDAAGIIPVVGSLISPLLSAGNLAKALWNNKQIKDEAQLGHGARQQNHLEVLADDLLERLQTMFGSPSPVSPMVLFLDDIHFATDISRDEETLQFLDRLLRTAALNAWPLLVITTHWLAPWRDHLQTTLENGKPWRMIEEMFKADSAISGKLTFNDRYFTKLPNDDLRRIALDHLPGLSEENLATILDKVDNVRWLVELLKALNDYLENFKNKDRGQALSPIGLSRLDTLLSQQGYLGVIRQRLQGDEMSDIRAVLGATAWHSYGLDFVGPLADSFEKRLIEQKLLAERDTDTGPRVLGILMQALNPASLIEGEAKDDQLPDLIRFPERGYLEVARELFDESHAHSLSLTLGRRVLEWMQSDGGALPRWRRLENLKTQKVFLGIAIEVLGKLQPHLSREQQKELANKEETLRELVKDGIITDKQFGTKYQSAKDALLLKSEDTQLEGANKYQAVAMAELVSLFRNEGQSQAWELAYALADHPAVEQARDLFTDEAQYAVVLIWTERKRCWPLARSWLETALARIGNDENLERLLDKIITLQCLADLDHGAGNILAAQLGLQDSLAIQERLSAEFGETPERMQDNASMLTRLADLYSEAGNIEAALQGFRDSLAIWERLLVEFGETPQRLRGKTILLDRLAEIDQLAGNIEPALQGFQDSLAIRERLLAEFGETPDRLRDKTITLERLADLDRDAGNSQSARQGLQDSLAIQKRLLAEYGETPKRLRDKYITLERVASLDQEAHNTQAARQGFQESRAIVERLLAEFGETPGYLRDKIVTLERLAKLDQVVGNTQAARQGFQDSLAIWERLLAEFGETEGYLWGKKSTLARLDGLD